MHRKPFLLSMMVGLLSLKAASQQHLKPAADTAKPSFTLRVMPQNFYIPPAGFFCKKEVQLQKLTRLNLFIRLGSKDYVDELEGKRKQVNRRTDE